MIQKAVMSPIIAGDMNKAILTQKHASLQSKNSSEPRFGGLNPNSINLARLNRS